jgi:hypothetical protein
VATGDPGEPATGDVRAFGAEEGEGAQVDVAWGDLPVAEGGGGGQRDHRLGHPSGGCLLDPLGRLGELRCRGLGPDHYAVTARLVGRLDHQPFQVPEDEVARVLVAAPEGGHRGQNGLLAEEVADDLWDVGVHLLVVGDTRSGRIDQGHMARTPRSHQPGHTEHRVGMEDLGIEVEVIDAAVDDIDPLEAVDGAGVHAVVIEHDQIVPLDQLYP